MDPTGFTESGRHDAERQALGSLLARFTADRDALLASIQGCQDRITDLLSRLESGGRPSPVPRSEAVTVSDGIDELRNAVERLRAEQQTALDQLRADTAQAMDRSDAALRAAVGAAPRAAEADDLTTLRTAVGALEARLAGVREQVDALAEVRTTIAKVENDVSRMESTMDHHIEKNVRTAVESRDAELATLRAEIEKLSARLPSASEQAPDATQLGAAIVELRSELGRVESSLTDRLEARLRFALDGWDQEARMLHAELSRLSDQRTREASASASLADTRTAVQEVRAEVERSRSAMEERVEARLRAATQSWTEELRFVRSQVATVVAGQADQAALEAGLREVRAAVSGLRADLGRVDATFDRRIQAPLHAVAGWEVELRALHARIDDVAAKLPDGWWADAARLADAAGLVDVVGRIGTRLAFWRAAAGRLSGLRMAAWVAVAVREWMPRSGYWRT